MTNNIEHPKASNKKLWLVLAGVSITVIGSTLAAVAVGNSGNSPDQNPEGINHSQDASSSPSGKTPTIESVKTASTDKELSFTINVKDIDTNKWTLEYQVADQDRAVKSEGKAHSLSFNTSVKLGTSAYYRIKVRAVDSEGKASDWSENYTVKLADLDGFKTVDPSSAYYQTGWAKGTDTTLEAAKKAINTAWNTEEMSRGNLNACLPINSGEMTPKLLLPPVPSVMPKEVSLKYLTTDWNGSAITITYLWCS